MPQTSIPTEVLEQIFKYLNSVSDLLNVICISKAFFNAAIQYLWKNPYFGPRISLAKWMHFLNLIENGNGYLKYHLFIKTLDEIWLYNGPDADTITPANQKVDSATELFNPSLKNSMHLLMIKCLNLRTLILHFNNDNLLQLPWAECLKRLHALDLRMRIHDEMCDKIFPMTNTTLKSLNITYGQISDYGLQKVSMPNLTSITIRLTDMEKRSRYQLKYEKGTSNHITDLGILFLLENCKFLHTIHIYRLDYVSNQYLNALTKNFSSQLKELTITLNSEFGITMPIVKCFLENMKSIEILRIISGSRNCHFSSDRVIEENDIFEIPLILPNLKKIFIHQLDFCKIADGFKTYYAISGTPWMLDELLNRFRKKNADIKLSIELK